MAVPVPLPEGKAAGISRQECVGVPTLPTRRWSRQDTVVKGVGLVVLQDKIVCQGFVGGSLADAGRKTNCKDGKRRRKKKCPKGSSA